MAYPGNIESEMNMGIPLPDGTRLSAKVWRPKDAAGPLPAIVEYLPYRKSDGTAARDHIMHPYFAAQGYVCLRVDRRGCGESQGLYDDEYSEEELQDGVDLINWIAAQDWCDGNIGIQGISWGGFNGLQIAARAPEALKAVITIGSTVDRYADDIHYKGGIQLGENIGWAATSMSWFSMPPDPEQAGDAWRDMWLERLENTPFLAKEWMSHPDRDGYWRHGSVCEDYSAIKAPVLALGGLHDGYRNTMAHLVENLQVPVKGVAGPWNHKYPNISTIGPSIDYLGEALRWWDRWLKGKETGVEADPAYRAYVMDSIRPAASLEHRPGRWVAEAAWPAPGIRDEVLGLGDATLGEAAPFECAVAPDMATGEACGEYFPFGFGPGELPDDQSADDARSACFDGAAVAEDWDIVGAPRLRLRVAADRRQAQMVVRLCDLRPDGTSALITMGLLNLRHRNGFDKGEDLQPGEAYEVDLVLDQAAYRLPAGHRLRVAVSGSYWPYCWPEGRPVTLTLSGGSLRVPRRPAAAGDECSFAAPEVKPGRAAEVLREASEHKSRREEDGRIILEISGDHGRQRDVESGLITESTMSERWEISRDDPASASVRMEWTRGLGRGDWSVSTRVVTQMHGHRDHFAVKQSLQASEGDAVVFEKEFETTLPRYADLSAVEDH